MKNYLLHLWDTARASYWFIPTLFALAAVLMSFLLPMLDQQFADAGGTPPEWIRTNVLTARSTLSAIAGAMVAVTGTVFSITIVTLSLTSQQFGPRLLRRFMYDLPTQITLGVFLSTGFYCLLLLRAVEGHETASVPHVSVMFAVVLTVLSMAMLILFIHHVAVLIQAPHVVAAVGRDLDDAILRLFPNKIGQPASDSKHTTSAIEQVAALGDCTLVVPSTQEGYIQAIDGDRMMQMAGEQDIVLRLRSRPGDFIGIDTPLADLWMTGDSAVDDIRVDDLTETINGTVIVGMRRTPRQDVECAIDELVEVAVRALSPGINDPFTAMNCIDRLGASLGRLAERELPSPYRCETDGRLRVITRPVAFSNVLNAALNQIRQYGRDSVAVTIRLLEALASIAEHVQREVDRDSIRLHAELIANAAESFSADHDQDEVRNRLEQVETRLKGY